VPRFIDNGRSAAIGARLCLARITAGVALPALADEVGMSYQQLYKYERGRSRLPAVMLEDLGRLLGRPAVFFLATDDTALARAMLLELPEHPALRRQFHRAIAILKQDEPAEAAEASQVPA
jgi:transcriptional regulator with XRE-family HTH domain